MSRRRDRKPAAGWARGSWVLRLAPLLLVGVVVLLASIAQSFSVGRVHQENLALRQRLDELRGDLERARADVHALTARERIETIASAELGLRPPQPGEQVFLPEWSSSPSRRVLGGSIAAGLLDDVERSMSGVLDRARDRLRRPPRAGSGR